MNNSINKRKEFFFVFYSFSFSLSNIASPAHNKRKWKEQKSIKNLHFMRNQSHIKHMLNVQHILCFHSINEKRIELSFTMCTRCAVKYNLHIIIAFILFIEIVNGGGWCLHILHNVCTFNFHFYSIFLIYSSVCVCVAMNLVSLKSFRKIWQHFWSLSEEKSKALSYLEKNWESFSYAQMQL